MVGVFVIYLLDIFLQTIKCLLINSRDSDDCFCVSLTFTIPVTIRTVLFFLYDLQLVDREKKPVHIFIPAKMNN